MKNINEEILRTKELMGIILERMDERDDDGDVTNFRVTAYNEDGRKGEVMNVSNTHELYGKISKEISSGGEVKKQLTKGKDTTSGTLAEVEDVTREPQTEKFLCCWLRGGCCGWEKNLPMPHYANTGYNGALELWAGYVIEWDACCGNSKKGRCC